MPIMAGEKKLFVFRLRPSRRNYLGLLLVLTGFLLILLCLIGSRTSTDKGLHFARLTERPAGSLAIYAGWQGYCIERSVGDISCYSDSRIMTMPFDVTVVNMFNGTFPALFQDPAEQDSDLNPMALPNPPHDPKIYPASVLCLLTSGASVAAGIVFVLRYPRYQDKYFSRGFLAWGSAVLALLLLAQSTLMYQNGVKELNLVYPHLEAVVGPNLTLVGVAFACFAVAGYLLLHDVFKSSDEESALGEGYNPL
ncbi:hypothetical protein BX666DRAFT_1916482 [Dichotomocladium elegans]|nr:hypothetical protein BX666DRAFT_1916482 [Dichotomocladium elegans]